METRSPAARLTSSSTTYTTLVPNAGTTWSGSGIWYPNEATPFIDTATRTIDVEKVYDQATPRYHVVYGQNPLDTDTWGRVTQETVGDPASGVGGTYFYSYTTGGLPSNRVNPSDPIAFRCTVTDRNGYDTVYDFNGNNMPVRVEVKRESQPKISIPSTTDFPGYVTWTKYNEHNQPLLVVYPEGNSVEYEYEDGNVPGISGTYNRRVGLLLRETRKVDNPLKGTGLGQIPARRDGASNGQTELTTRYFYDPLFNRMTAMIEPRGNPIDVAGTYFTPQNGGTTPTNSDRSRYATITLFDYQKNQQSTVSGNGDLQAALNLTAAEIDALIDFVDDQMKATDGTGGLPSGFQMDLGDINGDGMGDGAASGLPTAKILGNAVKTHLPSVRLIGAGTITTQVREELFTYNDRGMPTTRTDAEGNLTVNVYYPFSDPEGDGRFVQPGLGGKQYGRLKEVHVDADPDDMLSLVGKDGDLADFIAGKIPRTNTPGVYQDLTTRYEGFSIGAGAGCACCAYDALGNPLAETDARGFTTRYERNELGEVFRTIGPDPYRYQTETYYDANRNVIRADTEDQWVQYESDDPTSPGFAHFVPTGSGTTAQVPSRAGFGGAIRPGWFTDLMTFDLLDNLLTEDLDATGSEPERLVTTHEYDGNQNRIRSTKPEGNTVEYDHDERNLPIAQRVGNAPDTPAVSVMAYGGNGNVIQQIGPAARGGSGNHQTVIINDAFDSGTNLTHTGDFASENILDGFDRVIKTIDAVGNVELIDHDPSGRVVKRTQQGPVGGPTPTNRNGTNNVDLTVAVMRFDEAGREYEYQENVFVADGTTLSSSRNVDHTAGGLETNSTANGHTATVQLVTGGSGTANSTYVLTRTVYDRTGRVATLIADNTGETTSEYDGANRLITQTDAVGNIVEHQYDANGNVTLTTRIEKCTITAPSVPDEMFRTAMRYDSLNRLILTAQQGADGSLDEDIDLCACGVPWVADRETLITLTGYDSRNNQTLTVDPKGNTTITVFDGASRPTQTHQHLREKGQGQNPPEPNQSFLPFSGGTIATISVYDGNSRLVRLIDDNGNPTNYEYDTLDRETAMTFREGSTRTNAYNEAGDVVTYTDENGSVHDNTFDPLGRKTQCDVTKATGVIGTDQQTFQYDGLSRMTKGVDTIVATSATVDLFYDSLSRTIEDGQSYQGNTRHATNTKFASHPVSEFTFPDGRTIENTYDLLYRRTLVHDPAGAGTDIAQWQFFGPQRTAECTLGNGLIATQMNDARTRSAAQEGQSSPAWGNVSSNRLGYDGAGRMTTKRYLDGGINGTSHAYNDPESVVGFTTAFDRSSNKFYERHLHAESRSHLYEPFDASGQPEGGYDSVNRLRQYQRGTLSSTGGNNNAGGGSVTTPISLPNTDESRTYVLDGLGNWRRTAFDPVGGSDTTQVRQHNGLNQITRTTEGATTIDFEYDGAAGASNGNLENDGVRKYEWDAFNRQIKVYKTPSTPVLIGEYTYDALGRRIRKVVTNSGLSSNITNGTTDFLYHSGVAQCCEERDGTNSVTKQYVWGIYIDELMQMKTLTTINGNPADEYYVLSDLLYGTMALTDSSASIVETYDSDAFGNTLIFTAAGTAGDWWADDATQSDNATCEFNFTGRRFDTESTVYFYRFRYCAQTLGHFIARDPLVYGVVEPGPGRSPNRNVPNRSSVQQRFAVWHAAILSSLPSDTNGFFPESQTYKIAAYLYAQSNPRSYTDPSGLFDFRWTCRHLGAASPPYWDIEWGACKLVQGVLGEGYMDCSYPLDNTTVGSICECVWYAERICNVCCTKNGSVLNDVIYVKAAAAGKTLGTVVAGGGGFGCTCPKPKGAGKPNPPKCPTGSYMAWFPP